MATDASRWAQQLQMCVSETVSMRHPRPLEQIGHLLLDVDLRERLSTPTAEYVSHHCLEERLVSAMHAVGIGSDLPHPMNGLQLLSVKLLESAEPDAAGSSAQLVSPAQYIAMLRAGQTVDAARLHNLRGRLCRGREPQHFQMLGYGSTGFVLGGDGLKLFLDAAAEAQATGKGGAPLEMLLKIGYDILDIYSKLVEGWVFDLVVWDAHDLNPPQATWDGIADVLEKVKPDVPVASEMRRHMTALRAGGSGVLTPHEYSKLQQQFQPEQSGYSFKMAPSEDRLTDEAFAKRVNAGQGSAALVRKYLYDCCGLNDLYAGDGMTVLANGERGIKEYLAVNIERVALLHMATAIGAPTLEECLERISGMYEALNKTHGVCDFHLARWVPPEQVPRPPKEGLTPRRLTPKQFVDMLRKGEKLPENERLEGLYLRYPPGDGARYYETLGGPSSWQRDLCLVGPPEQLQHWCNMLADGQGALECFLDISFTIVDIYRNLREGKGNQLMVVQGEPDGDTPNIFPATFDGIVRLCEQMYPDVVQALKQHREAVLLPMDEAEHQECLSAFFSKAEVPKGDHHLDKYDKRMTYARFQQSAQDPREVRWFIDHTLFLRGGWNGSGYERQFIGGRPTPMILAKNLDFTQMAPDTFDSINLGAPSQDAVVRMLCKGLEELREKSNAGV